MRDRLWVAYWSLRLLGYKVDHAKWVIYKTRNWRFVVRRSDYKFTDPRRNPHRLHLWLNEDIGRIVKVTIG